MIAGRSGADGAQVSRFLDSLSPVLKGPSNTPFPLEGVNIAATGCAEPCRVVLPILRSLGANLVDVTPRRKRRSSAERPDVVLLTGSYVISPAHAAFWLRRDVPHLPLVFGDRLIRVGPWVTPGEGPCLHCVERHRLDRDSTWAAQACQLLGMPAPTLTPFGIATAAPMVVRMLLQQHSETTPPATTGTVEIVELESGARSRETIRPHPECCCQDVRTLAPVTPLPARSPASD